MKIDARKRDITDVLIEIKGLMSELGTKEIDLRVFTGSRQDAGKIAAFAGMSGFDTDIISSGEFFIVYIKGSSCGCFR